MGKEEGEEAGEGGEERRELGRVTESVRGGRCCPLFSDHYINIITFCKIIASQSILSVPLKRLQSQMFHKFVFQQDFGPNHYFRT